MLHSALVQQILCDDDEDRIVPAAEYREVLSTVIAQGLQNFTDAKEAILAFTSGTGSDDQLQSVISLLEEVRGVSMILPMAQVEAMLVRLKEYVRVALLENSHQPDEEEQDKVADVVTAIEYYFEAIAEGRPGVEAGLRTGEEALATLVEVHDRYASVVKPAQPDQLVDEGVEKKSITNEANSATEVAEAIELRPPEIAPVPTPTPAADAVLAPQTEYDEFEILGENADEEILEIFIEEALEVLDELHNNLPQWKSNSNDEEALSVIRRCFHTLKGSGRLIGAQLIGEFSWKFENILNRIIDNKIEPGSEVLNALDESVAVLPQLIEQLQGNREPVPNVYQLMAIADVLAEGRELPVITQQSAKADVDEALEETPAAEDRAEQPEFSAAVAEEEISIDVDELATEEVSEGLDFNEAVQEEEIILEVSELPFEGDLDEETEIDVIAPEDGFAIELSDEEFESGDEVSLLSNDEPDSGVGLDEVGADNGAQAETVSLNDELAFEIEEPETAEVLADELAAGMDPVLFQIYYDESMGHLNLVQQLLDAHNDKTQPLTANKDLVRTFHTLYGSARTAEIDQIAELCGATEKYVRTRQEGHELTIRDDVVLLIADIAQKVRSMLNQIKSGTMPAHEKNLLEKINKAIQAELQQQLQHSSRDEHSYPEATPETEPVADEETDDIEVELAEFAEDEISAGTDEELVKEQPEKSVKDEPVPATAEILYGEIDGDLIDIFIEEADELIESCEEILQKITNNPNDEDSIHQLQRYMHTLKGGARMAELTPVGDLTHMLESLVIKVSDKHVKADKNLFDTLNDSVDRLAVMLKNVKDRAPIDTASDLVLQLEALLKGEVYEKRAVERYDLELDDLSHNSSDEEAQDVVAQTSEATQEEPISDGSQFRASCD